MQGFHCVNSVRIPSFSSPYFPAFGLITERYAVSFRIQPECCKIWTRKTPDTDTFHSVFTVCFKVSAITQRRQEVRVAQWVNTLPISNPTG